MKIPPQNANCPKRGRRGSVLLETVIAIPLYLLLIGATMWIGQLIYDKQNMVIADRYAAWNVGNRWNTDMDITAGVQSFFPDKTHDDVTVIVPTTQPGNGWYQEAVAGMSLTATMPSWTAGWIYSAVISYGADSPPASVGVTGRDNRDSSGDYCGHVVLMRSPGADPRTNAVAPDDSNISFDLTPIYDF